MLHDAHCAVVEIRQYTIHSGRIDTLIDLFDRYFADGLTADGIHVLGTFRTVEDPNRFFWMRGFPTMRSRHRSLEAFYYGPIWQAQRDAANAT